MKIQQMNHHQNTYLIGLAEDFALGKTNTVKSQLLSYKNQAVDVSISEEGRAALRENLNKLGLTTEYTDVRDITSAVTNEVTWEHYTAMRDISSLTLKDGNYDVEDLAKSIMEAYETIYNKITKEHEEGTRQVSYDLTGTRSLTLEEDLAGLDKAFQMRLANLEGFITCHQTNKAFAHPNGFVNFLEDRPQNENDISDDYNVYDDEYRKTTISMMQQAREEFLALFKTMNYKQGAAIGIISGIMNNNADFVFKTQKLFSKE
ncbi:hypothetical protein [Konateibacter massiliensis]|uniref:hypothetical protein n=1 Tax=Konateibacter massiliensis TaxID=2002841 RepID=UPI000C150B65|nr:hypothetical protein [Konateibacter massiliensis]